MTAFLALLLVCWLIVGGLTYAITCWHVNRHRHPHLRLSDKPTFTGGFDMATGDPIISISLPAIADARIASRHVVITDAAGTAYTLDVPGADAVAAVVPNLILPAGTVIPSVTIASQAPGMPDQVATFPDLTIGDETPLALSGAPTLAQTAVQV